MIAELNEKNFFENIAKGLKLVEFYAPWCSYCAKQRAELNDMQNVTVYAVNGETSPSLVHKYGIHAFPAFIVFKDGKDVHQFAGLHNKFDLMNLLSRYMN
ncbi:MAG: thioredoxin family protein [Candidatus Gastranaerophilales bacterium]|nr:thioredoxin family protein [Candidatus Gastranaerophilales bacterium]